METLKKFARKITFTLFLVQNSVLFSETHAMMYGQRNYGAISDVNDNSERPIELKP